MSDLFVEPEFSLVAHVLGLLFHDTLNLTRNAEYPMVPFGATSTLEDHSTAGDAQLPDPT